MFYFGKEPYDFLRRRGQKQPEVLAAASAKRLYVENHPYLITGSRQNGASGRIPCIESMHGSSDVPVHQDPLTNNISSMAEKYTHMKETFRKRLAFGEICFSIFFLKITVQLLNATG